MSKIDLICEDLQECIGKDKYGTPETIDINKLKSGGYKVMCAGLIVAALKAQGVDLYNGSNTIWRKWLIDKGSISDHKSSNGYSKANNPLKSSQLEKGMAVFKWNPIDTAKYKDGLGDYQHIGFVTSVQPLRIVHASSEKGQVAVDTSIGKFCAWGKIRGLDYQNKGDVTMNRVEILVNLNLRKEKSTSSVRLLTIPQGSIVEYEGDVNSDKWLRVKYNTHWGYVLNTSEYVRKYKENEDVHDTSVVELDVDNDDKMTQNDYIILPSDIAKIIIKLEQLEKRVKALQDS